MSDEDLLGRVLFFNVALKNGHMMAQPVYEPQQSFISALVLEIERIDPEFAWVQLVFQMVDYHRDLRALDSVLQDHKAEAEQKKTFTDADGRTHEEDSWKVDTRWYRTIEARTKKIDLLHAKKTLALGIQGMWAGGAADLSHLAPFAKCSDDLDVLQVFPYRDPRMLIELAGRRIVTDLGGYASGYGGRGYLEPPLSSSLWTTCRSTSISRPGRMSRRGRSPLSNSSGRPPRAGSSGRPGKEAMRRLGSRRSSPSQS